ncbi:hypothetical protein BGX29_001711 [Mortierella sp. GBA35]|nr:hypothetical protein BGX23_004949 [Mortierella sp. AD031]KAF9104537.1 hypothetical protein BGX29_001711 [Mortierella sp. GBA35]KAG0216922.1 hypothetical protein BGX33_011840 [Mortierella sp. NVP41]
MRSPSALWAPLLLLVILALTTISTLVSAQSIKCHACIRKAVPTVTNCTSLPATSLETLDKIILGAKVVESVETYRTTDPAGLQCLTDLMWDSVHYKGKLWSTCFDPANSCPWAEMMQWLEIIPKVASIYGAGAPPAQVLVGGPA